MQFHHAIATHAPFQCGVVRSNKHTQFTNPSASGDTVVGQSKDFYVHTQKKLQILYPCLRKDLMIAKYSIASLLERNEGGGGGSLLFPYLVS